MKQSKGWLLGGSPNVWRTFLFNFFNSLAYSIWGMAIFPPLIYRLSNNSNTTLGWISAVSGIAGMIAAFTAGALADRWHNRQMFTSMAGGFAVVGVMTAIYGVRTEDLLAMYLASGVFGLYSGMSNTATESLFADSTPSGQRTSLYSRKFSLQVLAGCGGSILTMVIFATEGDRWHFGPMKDGMYAGLSLQLGAAAALFSLRESYALGDEAEGELVKSKRKDAAKEEKKKAKKALGSINRDDGTEDGDVEDVIGVDARTALLQGQRSRPKCDGVTSDDNEDSGGTASGDECETPNEGRVLCGMTWRSVPYILVASDIILFTGSGMTVRFFPLFFINDLDIHPIMLNGIFVITVVVNAILVLLASKLSQRIGRLRVLFIAQFFAPCVLSYMAAAPLDVVPMVIAYIVRSSILNSTLGLTRAVLMDHVAKRDRGKWNAMESLGSATWCGSAVIGGYLADSHGYQFAFGITAALHFASALALLPAIYVVRTDLDHAKKPKPPAAAEDGLSVADTDGAVDTQTEASTMVTAVAEAEIEREHHLLGEDGV